MLLDLLPLHLLLGGLFRRFLELFLDRNRLHPLNLHVGVTVVFLRGQEGVELLADPVLWVDLELPLPRLAYRLEELDRHPGTLVGSSVCLLGRRECDVVLDRESLVAPLVNNGFDLNLIMTVL